MERHYPLVRYTDHTGEQHTVRPATGTGSPRYEVGEEVSIYFNPANPESFRFGDFMGMWGWSVLGLGLGTAFVAWALMVPVLLPPESE